MNALFVRIGIMFSLIGTVLLCLTMIFQGENILIEQGVYNGINIYTLNISGYIENINTALGKFTALKLEMPEWAFNGVINSIISIINGIIMIINILLYPLRIGGYILYNIIALLGFNVQLPQSSGNMSWLIIFAEEICDGSWSQIPYIKPL